MYEVALLACIQLSYVPVITVLSDSTVYFDRSEKNFANTKCMDVDKANESHTP